MSRPEERPASTRSSRFRPPLADALLRRHEFFELYPLDGGGALVHHEMVGTLVDREIAARVMSGALREWGDLPALDFSRLERWRSIEKSCWLNRMYFVVSLARAYALTGDEALAKTVRDVLLHFIRNFPPPKGKEAIGAHLRQVYRMRDHGYNRRAPEENRRDETDVRYIWFDFQPAARIVHMIHALHFLKGSASLSRAHRREILASVREHAEVLYVAEKHFLTPRKNDNHQSLRGLALLLAGARFGEGRFVREGVRLCNFHMAKDFTPDGALAENSPSYHAFGLWHLRDAVLLAQRHGFELRADAPKRLGKGTRFLAALRQPDGCSPVINDGYPVRLNPFLATLPERREKPAAATSFKDAGLGVCRTPRWHVLLDVSPFTGRFSHYHAGKNALTLWMDGRPFLVDSGCCNYDDPLFSTWYKRAEAHSSLLVNGQGDGTLAGTYDWQTCAATTCRGWRRGAAACRIAGRVEGGAAAWKGVSWTRTVRVSDEGPVSLVDEVVVPAPVDLCFVFNLHPEVKPSRRGDAWLLTSGGRAMSLQVEPSPPLGWVSRLERGRCYTDFAHRENRRILFTARGKGRLHLETRFLGS